MKVTIVTDSASDLPKELAEEYGIHVMPLLVYLGDREFLDGETIDPKTLFDGMRQGQVYKTAQARLDTLRRTFARFAESGESVIYAAFSSGLSGTYQSSVLIRNTLLEEYPDLDLDIVDTKCASTGFGLVVLQAAKLAREGRSKAEILRAIRFHAAHMEHIFTVDNLEYLYRGGRVSRTAALLGGLLNIKPVLHVEDGLLVPLEKMRGRRKVLERMVELMAERGADVQNQLIGISHGDDPEAAETLQSMIRERFGCEKFVVSLVGSAIGAHSGPGTLALFFLNAVDSFETTD